MMEYRVTFGQKYPREPHPTFPEAHRDGWVTIIAPDEARARQIAFAHLGLSWAFIYDADAYNEWVADYPRGELARWAA